MINRRQLLAGMLAKVAMPRVPAFRGDRIVIDDPWSYVDAPLLPFTTWPGDPRAYDNSILWPPDVYRDMAAMWDRTIGYAMHDAAEGEVVTVRIG